MRRKRDSPHTAPLLDDDPAVRRAAVEALGLIGGETDVAALVSATQDPAPAVRASALRVLAKVGGRGESEVLRAGLRDRDPFVRTSAAHAVGRVGDRRVVGDLIAQARGDSYNPASAAARALVTLDPGAALAAARRPGAGPHLQRAATRVRSAAAVAQVDHPAGEAALVR